MNKILKITVFIVSVAILSSCSPKSQIDERLIGNWMCKGNWEYGFFEDLAIYEKDFWDYKQVENVSDDCINVQIAKNDRTVDLQIQIINSDSVVITKDGTSKVYKSQRQSNGILRLPFAPMPEDKDSAEYFGNVKVGDTATVIIYYRNTLERFSSLTEYLAYEIDGSIEFRDITGRKRIKCDEMRKTQNGLCLIAHSPVASITQVNNFISHWAGNTHTEPGDTTFILFNTTSKFIYPINMGKYTGIDSRSCYYEFNQNDTLAKHIANFDTILQTNITIPDLDGPNTSNIIYNQRKCKMIEDFGKDLLLNYPERLNHKTEIIDYVIKLLNRKELVIHNDAPLAKGIFGWFENDSIVAIPAQYVGTDKRTERIRDIDSLQLPSHWAEVYLAKDCYYALNESKKPLEQWQLDIFHQKVHIPYLVEIIDRLNTWYGLQAKNESNSTEP